MCNVIDQILFLWFVGSEKPCIYSVPNRKQSYVIIHTQKEEYKQYGKISDFEEKLKEKGFLRIHKSFLINMNHVEKIENRKAYLSDRNVLTCSKERYSEIQHKYLVWKGR